ncbi:MAG: hypothetical protein HY741_25240 [Chloroflexi bacterium]|nr:hypothetical protein [Chloroflexota bacterium]
MLHRIFIGVCLLACIVGSAEVSAQGGDHRRECPPNTQTIWIARTLYGNPQGEIYAIPFQNGTFSDQNEGMLNNYVTGVLEGEFGGSGETALNNWDDETLRAASVAARTVAYAWCGIVEMRDQDNNIHYGVDDETRQHYRPGHAGVRTGEYRTITEGTTGQFLSHGNYSNSYFDLQYRTYVGRQTNSRTGEEQTGPHKGVLDPVGAVDENAGTGMGQHSANHWVRGFHNERLADPVDVPNVRWTDYRQILTHYYTGVHLRNANGDVATPDYRWNLLQLTLQGPIVPDDWTNVTLVLQNTGTVAWGENAFALSRVWCPVDSPSCPTRADFLNGFAYWLDVVQIGDSLTLETELLGPPSDGRSYRLYWDLLHTPRPSNCSEGG